MFTQIVQVVNDPIPSNCFLLFDKTVNDNCLVIDPGSENPDILEEKLKCWEVYPQYIILTHEHFDHVWGCNYLIEKYRSKIICSSICLEAIQDPKKNHSLFYNQKSFKVQPVDGFFCVEDIGFRWEWNQKKVSFFTAEGHTNAGTCFMIEKNLFTGDTLLKDIRTVTKLFCGSKEKLLVTIDKIRLLQGDGYHVYPGHGDQFELDSYDLNKAL